MSDLGMIIFLLFWLPLLAVAGSAQVVRQRDSRKPDPKRIAELERELGIDDA